MWAVSDIVLELQSSGRLLAGKDECDPFAAALVQGLCAKIKGLEGFNAMHAVEIKTAAETAFKLQLEKPLKRAFWLHQHVRSLPLQSLKLWSTFRTT